MIEEVPKGGTRFRKVIIYQHFIYFTEFVMIQEPFNIICKKDFLHKNG